MHWFMLATLVSFILGGVYYAFRVFRQRDVPRDAELEAIGDE